MCTREFRARKRANAENRRTAAEANLPPRATSGAGRFRAGDEVTINGARYRVTAVDAAAGTVRGVPADGNGPERTIRERNPLEREAMDAATIDRENPEAAIAARKAANADRAAREARERANQAENARREAEASRQAGAAQTPAEAQRAQQEADAVVARVQGMEFTTGDGVTLHGGGVSFGNANYGVGHGGNVGCGAS